MKSESPMKQRRLTCLVLALLCLAASRPAWGLGGVVYNVPPDSLPLSEGGIPMLFPGATANLYEGGELAHINAHEGSILNIYGGEVTPGSSFFGQVNMFGGTIREYAGFGASSIVNIHEGLVSGGVTILGTMNLHGGAVGGGSDIRAGATVNVVGGLLGSSVTAFGGEVNLLAGSIGDHFGLTSLAAMNIRATTALLNGAPIPGLNPGETVTVPQRGNFELSGQLVDGSPFSFQLNDVYAPWLQENVDLFEQGSTVNVTLVPEPAGVALAALGFAAGGMMRRWRFALGQ
jgi:hypothetical protein